MAVNRPRFSTLPDVSAWAALVASLLVWMLVAACSSTTIPATGDVMVDLGHVDPRVRVHAAQQAVTDDRMDLATELVTNLRDDDGAVRMFTVLALRKLFGQDFGFKPYGTVAEREEGISRWEAWLASRTTSPSTGASSRDRAGGRGAVEAAGDG